MKQTDSVDEFRRETVGLSKPYGKRPVKEVFTSFSRFYRESDGQEMRPNQAGLSKRKIPSRWVDAKIVLNKGLKFFYSAGLARRTGYKRRSI